MNKNERLCYLLEIEWEKPIYNNHGDLINAPDISNPDFTTPTGKIELLRLMKDNGYWNSVDINLLTSNDEKLVDDAIACIENTSNRRGTRVNAGRSVGVGRPGTGESRMG